MIPTWVREYTHIPFRDRGRGRDGFDCWGLVIDVLERQFGICGLPDYRDRYVQSADGPVVLAVVEEGRSLWRRVERPVVGSVVMLKIMRRPVHCGIVIAPNTFMHALAGVGIVVEELNSITWRNRIEGFYEYAG